MTLSKNKIKDEVKDKRKSEDKLLFKKIDYARDSLYCKRTKYEEREQSLKDALRSMNDNDKTDVLDNTGKKIGTKTLSQVRVIRGKDDDVIGWEKVWQ